MKKANIEVFIDSWNRFNEDRESFNIVINPELNNRRQSDIWLINVKLTTDVFKRIAEGVTKQPDLNLCFFLEPKEMIYMKHIEQLQNNHPFINIGTIIKPTQYSRVDTFLKSVMNKKDMVTFDDKFDDIDFDFD